MVVIRLARGGSKKNPYYHIVAADKRRARDSRYIERLGFYNPMARGQDKMIELVSERVDYWVKQGAQPSERVLHLMKTFAKIAKGEIKPLPTKAEMKKAQQEVAEKAAFAAKKKADAEAKAAEAEAKKAEKAAAAEAPKEEAKAEEAPKEEVKAEEAKPAKEAKKEEPKAKAEEAKAEKAEKPADSEKK